MKTYEGVLEPTFSLPPKLALFSEDYPPGAHVHRMPTLDIDQVLSPWAGQRVRVTVENKKLTIEVLP